MDTRYQLCRGGMGVSVFGGMGNRFAKSCEVLLPVECIGACVAEVVYNGI